MTLGPLSSTSLISCTLTPNYRDWDGGFYLGQIPEVAHTFNVVGNGNEYGLVIGETTFGGIGQLDGHGQGHLIDYGTLIWITLQRYEHIT